MTDVEELLTDHLRRRAAAATPRHDLEGVEQGTTLVSLIDLDEHRPRRRVTRTIIGLAAAVASIVAIAGILVITSDDDAEQVDLPVVTDDSQRDALRVGGEVLVSQRREDGTGWDLAAQDPQTGAIRKLVATEGITDCVDTSDCSTFIRTAEWSPDGSWVAFTVVSSTDLDGASLGQCPETTGVWVKGAVGEPRQLTTQCGTRPDAGDAIWAWSPDGARLAHVSAGEESDTLSVIDPSSGARTTLDAAIGHIAALDWSPDGTRIAYAYGNDVYQVEVDGEEPSLLADSFSDVIKIAWSPDGSQILVHDQGRYRIQVMNADGSDLHSVLEGEDACCETEWSPQGDRILYMLSVPPPEDELPWYSEVWTVSADGSNAIEVFDAQDCGMESQDTLPVWAPNGTQVAYYGCEGWVVANADGTGEPQPLGGFTRADQFVPLVHRSWDGGGLSQGRPI